MQRGLLNKLKLIGIKGWKNGKKPISSCLSCAGEGEEGVEREALTSL